MSSTTATASARLTWNIGTQAWPLPSGGSTLRRHMMPYVRIFRMFTHAHGGQGWNVDQDELTRYYAAVNALGLKLVSSDGLELATGHIHIVDWEGDDELELEVHVTDPSFWKAANSGR